MSKRKRNEYMRQWRKTWSSAQLEREAKRNREWHHKNPEKSLLQTARVRARRKGLSFEIDISDVVIPTICPCLGIQLVWKNDTLKQGSDPNHPTIDRIDPTKGYVKGNVWVISWRANRLKSDATLQELRQLVKAWRDKLER